jgi:hypothetical protein
MGILNHSPYTFGGNFATSPSNPCNMQKFVDFIAERHPDAASATPVDGKNGRFISVKLTDGSYVTYPMGKKSYELDVPTDITELNVVISDDGQAIATMNTYVEAGATFTFK